MKRQYFFILFVLLIFCIFVTSAFTGTPHAIIAPFVKGNVDESSEYTVYVTEDSTDQITGSLYELNGYFNFGDDLGNLARQWLDSDMCIAIVHHEDNAGFANHKGYYGVVNEEVEETVSFQYLNNIYVYEIPFPQPSQHNNNVELFWQIPTESLGDPATDDNIDGYHIYRSEISDFLTYKQLNSVIIPKGSEYFTDTSASPGTTYYYVIKLVFKGGVLSKYFSKNSNPIIIPTAGSGVISGVLRTSVTGQTVGVEGANITVVETGQTAVSGTNGNYVVMVPAGTYTLRIEKQSFGSVTLNNIAVADGETTPTETEMTLMPGDYNGNGTVGLEDAAGILQIVSGLR